MHNSITQSHLVFLSRWIWLFIFVGKNFFVYVFCSILGMHIFGCKFSLKTEAGDTVPDRKNFDSLLWAIVTVFQVQMLYLNHNFSLNRCDPECVCLSYLYPYVCVCATDSDSGGLEHGAVQRHGLHIALCCALFRGSNDIWELCALQFAGCHLG